MRSQNSTVLQGLITESGLMCPAGSDALPASDPRYTLQIERTLGTWAAAVASVHSTAPKTEGHGGDSSIPAGSSLRDVASLETTHSAIVEQAWLDSGRAEENDRPIAPAYAHMSRVRLCEILEEGLAMVITRGDDPVLLQGAPTLDNLRLAGLEICGFSDWSTARIGDRHWDLALVCRDILERLGPSAISAFVNAYGPDLVDPVRLDWYTLAIALLS